jgi:hypothetical protein
MYERYPLPFVCSCYTKQRAVAQRSHSSPVSRSAVWYWAGFVRTALRLRIYNTVTSPTEHTPSSLTRHKKKHYIKTSSRSVTHSSSFLISYEPKQAFSRQDAAPPPRTDLFVVRVSFLVASKTNASARFGKVFEGPRLCTMLQRDAAA